MNAERKIKDLIDSHRPFRSILVKPRVYKALTVAGSDPSGGAGIQADLKTFSSFDVWGSAVITALTAQNTTGVDGIFPIDPDFIRRQLVMVLDDLGPQPIKTGMIPTMAAVEAVSAVVQQYRLKQLVVDPVLLATSGDALVAESTLDALRRLIGQALLVTPNLAEAAQLSGLVVSGFDEMKDAALQIYRTGVRNVLIKGGHMLDDATDLFFDGKEFILLKERRIPIGDTHGTGCTYAAAITAGLAKGMPLLDAVINAKIYITRALKFHLEVGKGSKVLNFRV
jgi:hydroxymethylpyrimidine/phosphomethylpyrimidine kinase